MGGSLPRWLAAPRFDDELVTQRARLLHRVLLAVLVIIVPFAAAGVLLGPRPLFALGIYGSIALMHAGLLAALLRGWVVAVGNTYVVIYFVMVTLIVWFGGGVAPNHSAAYVTVTLLAGLTVSPTAGIVTACCAGAVTLAMAWAQAKGLLPTPFQPTGLVEDVTSNLANLIFAAVFVTISMGGLRDALARATSANAQLRERARLDAALASLGQLVLTVPSAQDFMRAVLGAVRDTLAVVDVAIVEGSERRQVVAASGDGGRLFAAAPVVVAPELRDGAGFFEGLAGQRVALAPVPGKGSASWGVLVVRLGPAANGELSLAFLAASAAMLGTRLAQDEDHAMLRQAQKMEVVGRLAGGIAHDFNNLLTTILGCTTLLELNATGDDATLVRDIKEASERAALMTRQLLAFSRKQVLRPLAVDLNAAVRDFERVLGRMVRSDVTVVLELCPEPAVITADRSSLEQVLLNLVVNARDAMPAGGRLTVATQVEADEVRLEVSDTGEGMSDSTQARLFEPFFTTKADGTGLGLPTVRSIVERTQGRIAVRSTRGAGTTFTLTFPRMVGTPAASAPGPRAVSGTGRVLLVDDDVAVRTTTRRVLEGAGYEVVDVSSADEALAVIAAGGAFGLVITDVVMPRTSGPALAQQLHDKGCRSPVLFVSGFVADQVPGEAFLSKPYQPAELLAAVARLLARAQAASAVPQASRGSPGAQ